MSKEKIRELFEILGASNQEIAECAECAPSTISRLRSGARKPKPDSTTVDTLITGVIRYASIHGITHKLLALTGVKEEELLDTSIRKWLFETDEEASYISSSNADGEKKSALYTFSDKLNAVMLLLDISNIKLAHLVNVDTSYISRFRNGVRSPKSNPDLMERICKALFQLAGLKELVPELMNLAGDSHAETTFSGEANEEELYCSFHSWLTDFSSSDHDAISHLLGTIDTFSPGYNISAPPLSRLVPDEIINDTSASYFGISGLRKAVLRFLGCAARDHSKELLLYSDQGMEWMIEDRTFLSKWSALMALCTMQGTRIRIIHNIDRDIAEMTAAIESWLPLYATGMVDSYYSSIPCGSRFSHTLFLCPDKACITACHAAGMDDRSIYYYVTDLSELAFCKDNFDLLNSNTGVLASFDKCETTDTNNNTDIHKEHNSLSLSVTPNKVVIVKSSAPKLTITFTHPLLCNAFHAYLENTNSSNNKTL